MTDLIESASLVEQRKPFDRTDSLGAWFTFVVVDG